MVTITVNNSYSQVQGLNSVEFNKLKKELSYLTDAQASYFSGGFQRRRYLIDKKGHFPTGLLECVQAFLNYPSLVDKRFKPSNIWAKNYINPAWTFKPYPEQIEAVAKAAYLKRGGIVMPTASGKSAVISMLAARLACRTLVIVPTVELKQQLGAELAWLGFVRVENIDSTALEGLTNFDCLMLDECHHAAAKTYQRLNKTAWQNIYYRYFFTATYFRNQENEQLLFEGICGKVVYELPIKTAVKRNIIASLDAFYIDLKPTPTDAYTWQQVYSQLVVNNEYRNKRIASLLDALVTGGAPTLCLVKEIAHGAILSDLTGVPFANGKHEDSRRYIQMFNRGEIKGLIGTAGILGEGVNTKPAEYVIVACLGKAKSAFMQWVGRVLRRVNGKESGKVIIFRDPSHRFCLRHFAAQRKILKEMYGVKAIKLEIHE